MQHKFASLVELRTIWDLLDGVSFANVVKQLLEIDVIGSYKTAIISGIFQQLYDEGETNDDLFYVHLLTLSQNSMKQKHSKSESKSIENKFDQLADGLLSHIASYLPAKNVFSKWNHVNRKFLQIGLKPSSIKHFAFYNSDLFHVKKNPPKFKYDITLGKLESLKHFARMDGIVDKISMKHLRSISTRIRMFTGVFMFKNQSYCFRSCVCMYVCAMETTLIYRQTFTRY